jgi:hypothetical protein
MWYDWYAPWESQIWYGSAPPTGRKSVEPYCNDSWEINASYFYCNGSFGRCCSVPNGWRYGNCG